MERHPARTGGRVQQRIEDRPVRNRNTSILHRFSFTERGCDGARIEMVPPDHDRRLQLPSCDEIIQCNTEAGALTLTQPANARGQALELDALARECDPATQMRI